MFPLALFLGIATYKNDRKIALYSLPLVAFGGLFAFYQSLVQMFPALQNPALCGHATHCTLAGPAPFLSTAGFAAIAILILFSEKTPKR
jgi:disulfide bond formation protein DsbB